jgi:hypothetical protein
MTCPFPHTRRDQTWLALGLALGAGIVYVSSSASPKPTPSTAAVATPSSAVAPGSSSSVRHVVLLQLKDDVPESLLAEFVAAAQALPSQIPQILSYNVGLDLGLKSSTPNHPIAITALFKDKYDYEVISFKVRILFKVRLLTFQ